MGCFVEMYEENNTGGCQAGVYVSKGKRSKNHVANLVFFCPYQNESTKSNNLISLIKIKKMPAKTKINLNQSEKRPSVRNGSHVEIVLDSTKKA